MKEEEYNALVEKLGKDMADKIKSQFEEATAALKTEMAEESKIELKAELDKLKAEIQGDFEEGAEVPNFKKLEDMMEIQAKAMKKLQAPQAGTSGDFRKSLVETLDKAKKLRDGKTMGFATMEVKVAGTITTANIIGADASRLPQPDYITGLQLIPERNVFIDEIVDSSNTNRAVITWADETNPDGDAAFIGEGIIKPLVDFDITPVNSEAKKVADKIKVSEEMLDDIDWMEAEINRRLRKKHDVKREDGILNGDGTGANLDGITNQASAFIAGGLAAQVDEANNWDALRSAINQIILAGDGTFFPTRIVLNPTDAALMDMEKATDGHYIMPPFQTANGTIIKGVQVIEKVQIPAGSFLVGDFGMSHVRNYIPFTIRIGFVNDDFELNLVTMIGESRLHHFIYTNETTAFVFDTFSNAKTALETI